MRLSRREKRRGRVLLEVLGIIQGLRSVNSLSEKTKVWSVGAHHRAEQPLGMATSGIGEVEVAMGTSQAEMRLPGNGQL